MPKLSKMPKMPKIKDVRQFCIGKSRFQDTAKQVVIYQYVASSLADT